MSTSKYLAVAEWKESHLADLPHAETDNYEYKSSRIQEDRNFWGKLKHEIHVAASAFWNTGGGLLIIGVDDNGVIDGGIPKKIGNQKLRDWVDQVLMDVEPPGDYTVGIIRHDSMDSLIEKPNIVLVIGFEESYNLPHMAPDYKYYVRAGAHSVPASHYLVESMRARRGISRPMLRGLLREHETKSGVVELLVLNVNDIPALNVYINFDPVPHIFDNTNQEFPLFIPVIDEKTPFRMDVARLNNGDPAFQLELVYHDLANRRFVDHQLMDHHRSVSNTKLQPDQTSPQDHLAQITGEIERLRYLLELRLQDMTEYHD